ncbi:hypothetical protein [Lederbergia citrea]|uniref:Uncharacterized protein n=1 Tax=Lederbergia citrea TaxID=2833581 RepID=A0A942UPK4_9BACI|nr:hypothetical protein [Lederbergia citrea]MBS4221719.1 hypothetical protein [Lederbergia citrea]
MVNQAYRRAVLNGYIEKNPCEGVQIKRREAKQLKYLEPELVATLLKPFPLTYPNESKPAPLKSSKPI